MNRILVTGASGMLGRATLEELRMNPDWAVVGQAFSRASDDLIPADLTNASEATKLVEGAKPDCIVHCAAERRPDISEQDPVATDAINQQAVATLAKLCDEKNIFFIYLSTDYVFDGSNPPYAADDTPNPLNYYGKSKLAGEREARLCRENALVLRVPVLFGGITSLDESAVTVVAKLLQDETERKVDHWARRFPTATSDVANVIGQIICYRSTHPEFHGTYHWSGDECFTKYDMAKKMAEVWSVSAAHLSPDPEEPAGAPRPRDCQLDCRSLEAIGIGARTPFAEAIKQAIGSYRP